VSTSQREANNPEEDDESTDEETEALNNDRHEAVVDEILPNGRRIIHPPVGSEASIQPYVCPKYFSIRVALLLSAVSFSLLIFGLLVLTVPVMTGRKIISFWMGEARIHDFNTAACGLYAGLVALRFCTLLCSWVPRGWAAIAVKVREGLVFLAKLTFAGFLLLGIIPLMIGFLFDVVVIVPLRVPLNQSPIMYLMQDWAFGVLHTKVICGLAMMGDWRLKEVLEEIYHAGLMNLNLRVVVWKLAAPVIMSLGLSLAIPYICVSIMCPLFSASFETETLILRRVYPTLLIVSMFGYLIHWQINKFFRLYEHIKNDKYLVGRRLVNYDPQARRAAKLQAAKNAAAAANNLPIVLPEVPQQHQQQAVNGAAAVIDHQEEDQELNNPVNDLHQRRVGDPLVIMD
jgi:E3 ubiquitin-protein ligase MARCH6